MHIDDNIVVLIIVLTMFGFSAVLFVMSGPISWLIMFILGFIIGRLTRKLELRRKDEEKPEEKKKI